MATSMVTGRMTTAKKEAGNRVLKSFGMNASQAINQLYDYLIENRALPFSEKGERHFSAEKILEAQEYVENIPSLNLLEGLSYEDIRRKRAEERFDVTILD